MSTSAGIARTPYLVTVHARVCDCQKPAKEMLRTGNLETAVKVAEGYWNVYLAFFGDQLIWIHFQVVDQRDGMVVWRDGGYTKEESAHGAKQEQRGGRAHDGAGSDARWIVSGRPVAQSGSGGDRDVRW